MVVPVRGEKVPESPIPPIIEKHVTNWIKDSAKDAKKNPAENKPPLITSTQRIFHESASFPHNTEPENPIANRIAKAVDIDVRERLRSSAIGLK